VVAAIQEQARQAVHRRPQFANDVRGEAARLITELATGDLNYVFFTNGGAEANENAVRMARLHTADRRSSPPTAATRLHLDRDRLTGDPPAGPTTRSATPPATPSTSSGPTSTARTSTHDRGEECERALKHLEQVIAFEARRRSRPSCWRRSSDGGILMPPPGYLAGVRELCDKHGILFIADEVMAGFARSGKWFRRWTTGASPRT